MFLTGSLNATLTGAITDGAAGTIQVQQVGSGTLILANSGNTYTGATIVSAGTLQVGTVASAGSVGGATGLIEVGNGGTLAIVNIGGPIANVLANNITNNSSGTGTVLVNSANTNTLSGVCFSDGVVIAIALDSKCAWARRS